jgi:ATP-dependent Clp protease ATP-binding subunit ClpC
MAGQPFAVVLLDEFEKAYEKVADRFLQLFDEGAFINGHGETIPCRSMILIATSNVGAEVHRDQPAGFFSPPDLSRIAHDLDRRLTQRFRIELLNRFDEIVHFHPLSRADVRTIAARELQSLKNRVGFKRSGLELEVDEAVLDWLAVHGYDPRFGARFLRRTLEREVTSALAALLVRGPAASGSVARLTVRRNRIEASLVPPSTPSIARRAPVTLPVGAGNETRSLDRDRLRATAENVGRSALALMAALDDKREEARRLLDTMNMPGFWDDADAQRRTLEQYRELDVAIQVEERFASPVRELAALIAGTDHTQVDLKTLARSVEAAAAALAQWTRRIAEEGDRAIWLLIERMDPFQPVEAWLSELTQMELAWCRRLDLTAAIIACELADGELSRVILEVEGPGAASYLACEEGVHRRVRRIGSDLKARIEVIAKRAGDQPATQAVVRTKSRRGPFGIALSCSARLELSATGQIFELMGGDPRALADLVASLEARGSHPTSASAVVARVYGQSGVGARDPRTDAIVLKLRDVLNGELDVFLDAWRRQSAEPVDSTV